MAKYRMATLFSGAGGLDTAFEESENFDLVFANDVLSAPAESYSKNFSHKIVDASEFGKGTKLPAYVVVRQWMTIFQRLRRLQYCSI